MGSPWVSSARLLLALRTALSRTPRQDPDTGGGRRAVKEPFAGDPFGRPTRQTQPERNRVIDEPFAGDPFGRPTRRTESDPVDEPFAGDPFGRPTRTETDTTQDDDEPFAGDPFGRPTRRTPTTTADDDPPLDTGVPTPDVDEDRDLETQPDDDPWEEKARLERQRIITEIYERTLGKFSGTLDEDDEEEEDDEDNTWEPYRPPTQDVEYHDEEEEEEEEREDEETTQAYGDGTQSERERNEVIEQTYEETQQELWDRDGGLADDGSVRDENTWDLWGVADSRVDDEDVGIDGTTLDEDSWDAYGDGDLSILERNRVIEDQYERTQGADDPLSPGFQSQSVLLDDPWDAAGKAVVEDEEDDDESGADRWYRLFGHPLNIVHGSMLSESERLLHEVIDDYLVPVDVNDPQDGHLSTSPGTVGGSGGGPGAPGGPTPPKYFNELFPEEEEEATEPSFDASVPDNQLYYWDPNVGLIKIDRSEFVNGEGPIPPTQLPDESTPAGRQRLANLFATLPEDTYYDPEIGHFVRIDAQGRHVIQADFSSVSGTSPGDVPRGTYDGPDDPLGEEVPTLYYYDQNEGYVEVDRAEFTDGTPPIPPTQLPDETTPNGRRLLALLFLTLPDDVYYDPEIGHFIQIQARNRHVIQANLTGYFPGGEQVGTDEDGNPIFASVTRDEDRITGDESIRGYDPETYIGDIYFDETTGQWIGTDEEGRPVIVDEDGYPIPFDELATFAPQPGYQPTQPERVERDLGEIGFRFFAYYYDPFTERYIGIQPGTGYAFVLDGRPDFEYDHENQTATFTDPETGEETVYSTYTGELISGPQDREELDPFRNPYELRLPVDPFALDFDSPVIADALGLSNSVLEVIQRDTSGYLSFTVGITAYQEYNRAGYIIGSNHSDAASDDDYLDAVSTALGLANADKDALTWGDSLNVARLETNAADDPTVFVPAVEVWFELAYDEDGELIVLPNLLEQEESTQPVYDGTRRDFLLQIAGFVEQSLREVCPVVTGRMRDSISIRLREPEGRFLGYEVGARIYYSQFVGTYSQAVDLTIEALESYIASQPVGIQLSRTTVLLDPHEQNTFSRVGPGILVAFAGGSGGLLEGFELDPATERFLGRFFGD